MTRQELQQALKTIKKGKFVKATWKSEKIVNGIKYEKVSNGVVRFVKYANIKGVVVSGKTNTNETMVIPNILYHNTNTNCDYIQFATTKVKAHSVYYKGGMVIDKATYETETKARPNNGNNPVFRVKLENLLALN